MSPELDISIWCQPHRLSHGWGHVVQIGDYFAGDLPGGFFQSLRYAKRDRGMPEVDPDHPHEEFNVSPEAFAALARELNDISYSFAEHPFTPMLGGGIYAFRYLGGANVSSSAGTDSFKTRMTGSRTSIDLWRG